MRFFRLSIFIILLIFLNQESLFSQKNDTLSTQATKTFHSPKKAAIMSAFLPGLGQAYNHKYWKIPIIYAGLATTIYFVYDNNVGLNKFKSAYASRLDTIPSNDLLPFYSINDLLINKENYWKNRDLSIILTAAIYALNILDASVDAHLFTFDISKDLSFRVEPEYKLQSFSSTGFAPSTGLKFTLKF